MRFPVIFSSDPSGSATLERNLSTHLSNSFASVLNPGCHAFVNESEFLLYMRRTKLYLCLQILGIQLYMMKMMTLELPSESVSRTRAS